MPLSDWGWFAVHRRRRRPTGRTRVGVGLVLAPRLADGDAARLRECPSQFFGSSRPPREGFLADVDSGVSVGAARPGAPMATKYRLAFAVPLARVPALMATLTGVGGGHLDEGHFRKVGFVLDKLGEFPERGILQCPVQPALSSGAAARIDFFNFHAE